MNDGANTFKATILKADSSSSWDAERFGDDEVYFTVEREGGEVIEFRNTGRTARAGGFEVGDFLELKRHGKTYAIKGVEKCELNILKGELRRAESHLSLIDSGPGGFGLSDGWEERVAKARAETLDKIAHLKSEIATL